MMNAMIEFQAKIKVFSGEKTRNLEYNPMMYASILISELITFSYFGFKFRFYRSAS